MTDPGGGAGAAFLERQSYRRRRLMDAARLLPLFGVLLFALPLLWTTPAPEGAGPESTGQAMAMSDAILYIFVAWSGLIVLVALFGYSTRHWGANDGPRGPGRG